MAEEATKRMVGVKFGKSRKALILALCYIYETHAHVDLLINKLITCQILFNPNITYTHKLQLQKLIKCTKIEW